MTGGCFGPSFDSSFGPRFPLRVLSGRWPPGVRLRPRKKHEPAHVHFPEVRAARFGTRAGSRKTDALLGAWL